MKLLVILLIVMILLFVVLVVWGAGRTGNNDPKHSDIAAQKFNQDRKSGGHSVLESFNRMFGGFSPTLKASALTPAASTFDLQTKTYALVVARDDKHDFRQAKFQVLPAPSSDQPLCADILYTTFNHEGADQGLDKQENKLDEKGASNEFTFAVLKGGGRLSITRNPNMGLYSGPCRVILK